MKRFVSGIILRVALVLPVTVVCHVPDVQAHEDSKGPHGGVVKEFGSFHMEGTREGGSAKFYLLDGAGAKGASADATGGSITVIADGGAPKVTKIEPGKFTEGAAPAEGKKVVVAITLKIAGKSQTAKYTFK